MSTKVANLQPVVRNLPADFRKSRPKSCVVGIIQSKFRHVETLLGSKMKSAFINLRNVNNRLPADSNGFCVSQKYAAVPFSGCAGLIAIFELAYPVKLPDGIIDGLQNRVQLTDMHWNPFRDDELAVGLENGSVNIWRIPEDVHCIGHSVESSVPEGKAKTPINNRRAKSPQDDDAPKEKKLADLEPFKVLKVGVGAKVTQVRYHPTTNNILAIALLNGSIQIWCLDEDGMESEPKFLLELNAKTQTGILSMAWSSNGVRLIAAFKDGYIRVFEPLMKEENKCIAEKKVLEITRAARVLFVCEDSLVLLVHFNKSSNRQCQLYRVENLELIHTEVIDTSTQPLVPHYDNDTSVLFLSGKGDRSIQMFEISADAPHFMKLSPFCGVAGHQAIAFHQKNVCDVMQVEFQRGWRLSEKVLESISFRVPRIKKDLFQRDLFPNALVTWEPVNTTKDWVNASLNPVKFVDLCPPNTEETLNVARMATQKLATRPKPDSNSETTTINGQAVDSDKKSMDSEKDSKDPKNDTTNKSAENDTNKKSAEVANPSDSQENVDKSVGLEKNGVIADKPADSEEDGAKTKLCLNRVISAENPNDIENRLKQGLSDAIEKVEGVELDQDRMEGVSDSEWAEPPVD